jgi:hypothetical protein
VEGVLGMGGKCPKNELPLTISEVMRVSPDLIVYSITAVSNDHQIILSMVVLHPSRRL